MMAETRKDRVISALASFGLAALLACPGLWMLHGLYEAKKDGQTYAGNMQVRAGTSRAGSWMGLMIVGSLGGAAFFAGIGVWTLINVNRVPPARDD